MGETTTKTVTATSTTTTAAATAAKVLLLVWLYFPLSIGLTFYQKWFIRSYKFPLLVVFSHYSVKLFLSFLVRRVHRCVHGRDRLLLPWRECLRCVAPIGLAASVDIGMSNWALEYITVSLYTMSKSTCIVFILLFSVLLSLEKLRFSLVTVVVLIASGLFLFTYRSQQFDWTGFALVELAALCAGVRWALSQFLMQRDEMGLHNPVDMVFHVQPWMILSILPLVLLFEGDQIVTELVFMYNGAYAPQQILILILLGGLIAFVMEFAEYLLLVNTSGLTLNILGIVKEILTLLLAHRYNGDSFSAVNVVGLFLCLLGIGVHIWLKSSSSSRAPASEKRQQTLLSASSESSDEDR